MNAFLSSSLWGKGELQNVLDRCFSTFLHFFHSESARQAPMDPCMGSIDVGEESPIAGKRWCFLIHTLPPPSGLPPKGLQEPEVLLGQYGVVSSRNLDIDTNWVHSYPLPGKVWGPEGYIIKSNRSKWLEIPITQSSCSDHYSCCSPALCLHLVRELALKLI